MITYHYATTRYNRQTEPRYANMIYQRVVHHELSGFQIIFRRCLGTWTPTLSPTWSSKRSILFHSWFIYIYIYTHTLPKTNLAPTGSLPKGNSSSNRSISGALLVSRRALLFILWFSMVHSVIKPWSETLSQEQGLSQAISIAMREQCPCDGNIWMGINECVSGPRKISRGVFAGVLCILIVYKCI